MSRCQDRGMCALWLKSGAWNFHKCLPFVVAFNNGRKYRINIISNLGCTSLLSCNSYLSTFLVSLVFDMSSKCLLNSTSGIFICGIKVSVAAPIESQVFITPKITLCWQILALIWPQSNTAGIMCVLLESVGVLGWLDHKAQLLIETDWAYTGIRLLCCTCCIINIIFILPCINKQLRV